MKIALVKALIGWLYLHYPYLCREIVIGQDNHIHKNPRRKPAVAGSVTLMKSIDTPYPTHAE